MNRRLSPIAACILLLVAMLASREASAHEFPLENVMNAFVRIERDRAHLVIRMPLHLLGTLSFPANAKRELELDQAGPATERALAAIGREVVLRENRTPLVPTAAAGRLALPSDRSFATSEEAVAHIARQVAPGSVIYADQGFFDAHLTYPIVSPGSDFTIQTTMLPTMREHLKLVVRFLPLDGSARTYQLTSLSGQVALDPRWHQAAWVFVKSGFFHILDGIDHLLFLFALIIPFHRLSMNLLAVITSFTVAHSITLIASAYGAVPAGEWFPPLVETLIALSIVYMALENIVAPNLKRRWVITGAFGLVHGFGFSYGLTQTLQFAGSHLLLSLLSFNIGIELGQILVLLVALPALALLFRHPLGTRFGGIILSALLAHTGWHWMLDRAESLRRVEWPTLDAATVVTLSRWLLLLLLVGGAVWVLARQAGRRAAVRPPVTEEDLA